MDSEERLPLSRSWSLTTVVACCYFFTAAADEPDQPANNDSARRHAAELYEAGRFTDALPAYEQLVADYPDDASCHERYGFLLASMASTVNDKEQRRDQRLRARKELLRAKELGDNSNLLQVMLADIPSDDSLTPFSSNQSIEKVMRSAEEAFSRGDLQLARTGYLLALQADPNLYEAALFMGDAFYKEQKYTNAGFWLQRATQIDPNRETAYRYWGDVLMADGKMAEAREQFIEAIIAEPYVRRSRVGLSQWVERNKLQFSVPQIQPKVKVTKENGQKTILTVDFSSQDPTRDGETQAWLIYATVKAEWMDGKFLQLHPDEKTYRHSLQEEAIAYKAAVLFTQGSDNERATDKQKQPQLDALANLIGADLLESYILLFQADQDIAQDYAAYRDVHRDQLRRMLNSVTPRLDQVH